MLRGIIDSLTHIAAPRLCRICGQTLAPGEQVMCLRCYLELPRTDLHRQPFNAIHQRLGHHHPVDRAAGWYYYRRQSPYAQMLVAAKYSAMPAIARQLGRMCADELKADGFFDGIDVLAPMPMYWAKQAMRGYNQAIEICRGVSESTGIEVCPRALRAIRSHGILSRQTRQGRYDSIAGTIGVRRPQALAGRHVLLVDDIITTGASATEAVAALAQASPAAISVLCLGLTALQ